MTINSGFDKNGIDFADMLDARLKSYGAIERFHMP